MIGDSELQGEARIVVAFGFRGLRGRFDCAQRPHPVLALRLIGTGLVRRKSPARAIVVSALTRPLAAMTRAGDPIGVRLVRSAL